MNTAWILQSVFTFVFLMNTSARAYSFDEVVIQNTTEEHAFFDTKTLLELAKVDREELVEETAQKLNDFFLSSGVHFEANGRFAVLTRGYYPNTYIVPREVERKTPVFEIEMPVTQVFLRAYVKFLSDNVNRLNKQLENVFSQVQIRNSPMLAYRFKDFYECLRTISVTADGDAHQLPCLPVTVKALQLKDESTVTDLANTYLVMYRASRISFISEVLINRQDEKILAACRIFRDPLNKILIESSQMIFIKPPTPWQWGTAGSREFDRAVSFYYTAPKITHLLGPYVTDNVELEQRRLCR